MNITSGIYKYIRIFINVYIKTNQRGHGNFVQKCIDIKSNTCFNIWVFFMKNRLTPVSCMDQQQ